MDFPGSWPLGMAVGRDKDTGESRGWSSVLRLVDKRSKSAAEDTDEQPLASGDPERTIIDGSLKSILDEAMDTGPDTVARNPIHVPADDEIGTLDGENNLAALVKAAVPTFEDATRPNQVADRTRVDGRFVPDDRTDKRARNDLSEFDEPTLPPDGPNAVRIEDSFESPRVTVADMPRPDIAEISISAVRPEDDPSEPPRDDDEALLEAPPIPAHLLKELGSSGSQRDAEVTMLDLAAQLGLAPEPSRVDPKKIEKNDAAAPPTQNERGQPIGPTGARGIKLEPPGAAPPQQLADPAAQKVAEMLKAELPRQTFKPGAPMRNETLLEHLPRWLFVTEGAAKVIPLIIAVFVLVGTVMASVMLVRGLAGETTEHVTLRFLPIEQTDEANPDAPPPLFTIETEPEGVLVVLDRKILGATPITFELPMSADRVGIELSSPYYETWIGESRRETTGEMRMKALLKRKR